MTSEELRRLAMTAKTPEELATRLGDYVEAVLAIPLRAENDALLGRIRALETGLRNVQTYAQQRIEAGDPDIGWESIRALATGAGS